MKGLFLNKHLADLCYAASRANETKIDRSVYYLLNETADRGRKRPNHFDRFTP